MTDNTQNQEAAGFEETLQALRPELHRYCARMTGSVIDGEDILQLALVKAFEASADFASLENPRAWLFKIAHNTALDHFRAQKREAQMKEAQEAAAETILAFDAPPPAHDTLKPFLQLPPKQRSAVILRDVLGHSAEEVAQLTETTIASVKAALNRGRSKLKEIAEAGFEGVPQLATEEMTRLVTYTRYFNDRNFDMIRAMLAEEVKLELVNKVNSEGKAKVSNYYGNYDRVHDWQMAPGFVEGRPAILAFDPTTPDAGPIYFILLEYDGDELVDIRDFRYARYVMQDVHWQRI